MTEKQEQQEQQQEQQEEQKDRALNSTVVLMLLACGVDTERKERNNHYFNRLILVGFLG